MPGPTLSEFIRASTEQILVEWEEFARSCSPAADSMDAVELRDHAAKMLRWIADDLETSQTRREQAEKSKGNGEATSEVSAATKHGALRFDDQFSLSQVFAEFRALRASVIRLWFRGRQITDNTELLDLTRFNEAIDQVLAESVERYSAGIDESRDMFVAILGHDLRNPLGAVISGANYLEQVLPPGSESLAAASRIHRSGTRMQRLISDLLDYSRERLGGELPISPAEIDMGEVTRGAIDEITKGPRGGDVQLLESGPLYGQWDRERVAQVVSNLVGNALQHGSAERPVTVTLEGRPEDVLFQVHNWGRSIPADAMGHIFEPAKRLTGTREEAMQGGSLGLGLHIAKLIAEAHGTTIEVASTEGDGTTFTVRWPRASVL